MAAASTAGDLTETEQTRLQEHVAVCEDCRRALGEFEAVAGIGAPLLAAELAQAPSTQESTNQKANTGAEELENPSSAPGVPDAVPVFGASSKTVPVSERNSHRYTQLNWNLAWLSLAAAILLTLALGIVSYRLGIGRGIETARLTPTPNGGLDAKSGSAPALEALEQQISDAGHARVILQGQVAERDQMIEDLHRQIQGETAALAEMKLAQAKLESSFEQSEAENQQKTVEEQKIGEERKSLGQKLETAEASLQKSQTELDSLRQQRSLDQSRSESLEAQIKDLHGQLRDREQTINKEEELLAHDRDIRDLMGARDLYIAEVYDIGRDGATQKPYGRVFYTRGKSLIFYAYDLDQQAGAKSATFQAWGRRGPDHEQALNLGVFFKDNQSKKRWVLKFDDAKTLEQIDAVFVTVEPDGESHKPSGKSLLFAYLKVNPNHP